MSLEQPPEVIVPERRRGVHWVEMIMSIAALLVSGVSIAVAVNHGNVMEKLVAANSLPYVDVMNANATIRPSGEFQRDLRIELRNVGVGPADVLSVRLSHDGRDVRNMTELLGLCCATEEEVQALRQSLNDELVMNQSRTHFIPAGESSMLFSIPRTEANAEAWQRFDQVRQRLVIETCYCSVFDECWMTSTLRERREPIDACTISEDSFVP